MPDERVVLTQQQPPSGRTVYPWPEIAQRLRAKPGEWMLVLRMPYKGTSGQLRRGRVRAVPPHEFEWREHLSRDERGRARTDRDGRQLYDLFGRALPDTTS